MARASLILTVLLAGCPDDDPGGADAGDAAEPCTMEARLGTGGKGADFVRLAEGDDAEVILGYQGFRFIQTILEVSGVGSSRVNASFTISVEGQIPYPQWVRADVEEAGDAAYSDPVSIYFNDIPYAQIVGKRCDLAVEVFHPGCSDTFSVGVLLLDEDPCIQGADDVETGGCSYVDGGVDDAGSNDAGADAGADAGE
ncbi:MAG: hypothetical protein HYY06_16140 [Deltaproteobacteria bacterium]|nr:hypothetical protein [Deltaproteobacteria bacterium]